MKSKLLIASSIFICAALSTACNEETNTESSDSNASEVQPTVMFGGFENQVKWGEHIVLISGCNDCHTPKKMGPNGPEPDMSLMLSGHPAQMPPPPVEQTEAAKRGIAVTQDLTAWVGAWGITYAVNLTPDSTGLGGWKEDQFIKALTEGKWMGLENTRPIMPPMPVEAFKNFSNDEIKAVFAYLKSIPAVHNIVPQAVLAPPPPAATAAK